MKAKRDSAAEAELSALADRALIDRDARALLGAVPADSSTAKRVKAVLTRIDRGDIAGAAALLVDTEMREPRSRGGRTSATNSANTAAAPANDADRKRASAAYVSMLRDDSMLTDDTFIALAQAGDIPGVSAKFSARAAKSIIVSVRGKRSPGRPRKTVTR